ncbi:M20 metallopeptidase family protein [Williamwhitmania taraxaci]|uniref:Amidohydrolase n=1 Tax=Williamwhitmania taraxaci TaxID=1640674 RepID=A0A1G6QJE4_9BACT|nr:M20 family metallopeptidase [Williamwhitmania taraxaci]SDC92602.1 amidohydrolase [Williamwhitmania taraxaci]
MVDGMQLQEAGKQLLSDLKTLRRNLHQNPELSFQEINTSAIIKERLTLLGIENHPIVGTGVYGLIRCGKPNADLIALRADMDALPVTEATGLPFASKQAGVMHACGHDMHMTCLLGAAELLLKFRAQLSNDILLVFQPAEEVLPGGAIKIIEEGLFDRFKPKAFLALHVDPDIPTGKFGFRPGRYMASGDEIYLRVHGKGGHAAMPHRLTDTVLAASEIIVSLQQIVSRKAPAGIPTVLSFGRFIADGATNVIPDEVFLSGTFRTFDEPWRNQAHTLIREVASNIAKAHGAECSIEIKPGYPCLYNDHELTDLSTTTLATLFGPESIVALDIRMTTEDFAHYAQLFPSVFFRLGVAGEKGAGRLHAGNFQPDEEAIFYGSTSIAWLAMVW